MPYLLKVDKKYVAKERSNIKNFILKDKIDHAHIWTHEKAARNNYEILKKEGVQYLHLMEIQIIEIKDISV